MTNKAPSAGTKVTTGENIPTTREAPGNVPEGSLAAESARKGGAFASNPGQHEQAPQKRSQQPEAAHMSASQTGGTADKATSLNLENQQTARGTGQGLGQQQEQQQQQQQQQTQAQASGKTASETGSASAGGLESQRAYGGAAPTYLAGQQRRDPAGPHGKNLTEGGFEGSGTEAGALPEPGSAQDPARAASRGLRAGAGGTGTGAGVGAGAGGVEEGSWYTPLKGDEPA